VIVLLPPSETKRAGGDGPALNLRTLSWPGLNRLRGELVDELVELAQTHLAEAHPGMEYEREHILFMAF
jgi:hypothetical protein